MNARLASLFALALCLTLSQSARAGTVYEDGPINGTVDAWTINFGFFVGDSFTVSAGTSALTGFSFGAWLFPGDILESVQLTIESEAGGGTIYFNQVVEFTASGCALNQYGYNVCTETGAFSGPTLSNGTYWAILQNAVVNDGDPVYWDENSGIGCHSPGCPSETYVEEGSIPAESFTVLGGPVGSTPESSSIFLVGSGAAWLAGMVRRKIRR